MIMEGIRIKRKSVFSSIFGFMGAILALSVWIAPQVEGWILYVADGLQSLGASYPQIAGWIPSTELWPDFARVIVPPDIVAAALVMKGNFSLFLIAGAVALFVSLWNIVRGKDGLPAIFFAAPFVTLLAGAVLWGLTLASERFFPECKIMAYMPEHGIAAALSALADYVTASKESLILWTMSGVGSLIGLLAGISGSRRRAVGWEGSVGMLLVLFAVSSELDPNFLRLANFLELITQLSCAGIIALGMTFVMVSGGIDLSSSSMAALLGYIMIGAMNRSLTSFDGGARDAFICAVLAIIGIGALLGLLSGLLTAAARTKPFIITFAAAAIYSSVNIYFSECNGVGADAFLMEIGNYSALSIPLSVWAFFVLAFFYGEILGNTRFGRCVKVTGARETRAVRIGINVASIKIISYILSGIATAAAAFFLVARGENLGSVATAFYLEIDVIAAVLIGGTLVTGGKGAIAGTVTGLMVLGLVNNLMNMFSVSPSLYGAIKGVLILASVMIYRATKRSSTY
ncbi:hypothetical protein FACS1894187_14240 [Synergistales bacterium]|nr:hypothetical protein FACS1894187_14240 [Synergistales bacterium]